MSQVLCRCDGNTLNTGTSGCLEVLEKTDYLVSVDYQDSDGNLNTIPKDTVIDQAYIDGKLNESDSTKRWTVYPRTRAIEDVRGDSTSETIDTINYLRNPGPRDFMGFFIDKLGGAPMKAAWDSRKCRETANFYLTSSGQIAGNNPDNTIGDLYPVRVESGTMDSILVKSTKETGQKVQIKFTVSEEEDDACIDFISSNTIAYSTKNWYNRAPIDIVGDEDSNTTTSIIIDMFSRFGPINAKDPITDLVSADFSTDDGVTTDEVYNTSTSASVALISVVESSSAPGRYTLTFVAQTLGHILEIDIFKTRYDMVDPVLVTIS